MELYLIALLSMCNFILAASSQASSTLYTATLYHVPVSTSTSTPKPLAVLSYNPTNPSLASLISFTPPRNSTSEDDLTQIVTFLPNNDPKSDRFRSSLTATYGFHPPYKGRFRIVVEPETGHIVGASWKARLPGIAEREEAKRSKATKVSKGGKLKAAGEDGAKRTANGNGDFDVVTVKKPPPVVFDKPAKGKGGATQGTGQVGAEGEEEVQEKTFFQK